MERLDWAMDDPDRAKSVVGRPVETLDGTYVGKVSGYNPISAELSVGGRTIQAAEWDQYRMAEKETAVA